jgi:hypothetical protein
MRHWILAGLTLAATVHIARADTVADWNEAADALELRLEKALPRNTIVPLAHQDEDGTVALAIFEAANAADRRYASYLGLPAATTTTSGEAAIAQAAHDVLRAKYPEEAATLDQSLALDLSHIAESPAKQAGIDLGKSVAKTVLARPEFDPARAQPYRPQTTPGVFTVPVLLSWPTGIETFHPFFLDDAAIARMMPPPPPPLTSETYARSYNEVKDLGEKTSTVRDAAGTANAKFWASGNEPSHALRAIDSRLGRSLVQNARTYALMRMALADARHLHVIAKFRYMAWRPLTAIRNGDTTGNPAITRKADWEPLLQTPRHPEYPCGHCTFAETTAVILAAEAGPRTDDIYFANADMPGAVAYVKSWDDYVQQVNLSRIQAGVHFRFSAEAAVVMARQVAQLALEKFAPPLK